MVLVHVIPFEFTLLNYLNKSSAFYALMHIIYPANTFIFHPNLFCIFCIYVNVNVYVCFYFYRGPKATIATIATL